MFARGARFVNRFETHSRDAPRRPARRGVGLYMQPHLLLRMHLMSVLAQPWGMPRIRLLAEAPWARAPEVSTRRGPSSICPIPARGWSSCPAASVEAPAVVAPSVAAPAGVAVADSTVAFVRGTVHSGREWSWKMSISISDSIR